MKLGSFSLRRIDLIWVRFALYNALRNRRRSLVTVSIAALGTAAILLAGGFAYATYEGLAQASARSTGHLIVGKPGHFSSDEEVPLQYGIDHAAQLQTRLLGDPAVRYVLPRVDFSGLISNDDKSTIMLAVGIDPDAEFAVKGPFLTVKEGAILEADAKEAEVVLGDALARSLKAKTGSSLTLMASTTDGALNALDVIVKGVVSTGIPDMDKRLVYTDIKTAQKLLNTQRVSSLGVFLTGMSVAAYAENVNELLKTADHFRVDSQNMQVETQITTFGRDGSIEKERRYLVFSQTARQSLVLMQSPAEKGQKILMLGDDFWMLLPGSQRPLRITPMQKLLGDASIGDISTMSWAQDYDGKLVAEERCQTQACLHLSLTANRKGVAYQHIDLWLGKTHHEPVKADLYVQSEKLAKQASSIMDAVQVPTKVLEMVLLDQLSSHKETHVRYLNRQQRTVRELWMNPMFLAKNPVLE